MQTLTGLRIVFTVLLMLPLLYISFTLLEKLIDEYLDNRKR